MGFEHIAEILHHPLRKFSLEEKQFAVGSVLILLWKRWDQHVLEWVKTSDIGNLYVGTLQREQVTDTLLSVDIQVIEKVDGENKVVTVPGILGQA
jgi:hypothetical protein